MSAIDPLRLLTAFRPPCLLPPQRRTLWTRPYMVRPALVQKRFGNGKKLLGLTPIMHRPHYYLVLIDDRWDLEADDWLDRLDEIWEAIAEEFGSRRDEDEAYHWPEEDSGGGCAWWTARADDVLTVHGRRRLGGMDHHDL